MVFDAQNGPQLVIRGISTALKMLNLPQKHPFFTFEAKKPLKQRVGAHFEHQKSFIYIKTWFFVLWLYSNSFNEGPTPYGIKRANLLCYVVWCPLFAVPNAEFNKDCSTLMSGTQE